jgi:hypothetical protein
MGRYDATVLEGAIKDVIRRKLGNQDEKLLDEDSASKCKV